MTTLLLARNRCSQCLTTRNRVVSGRKAADIVRDCRRESRHFVCHKGSYEGEIVHCRGVHDISSSLSYALAQCLGIPIVEVDPDNLPAELSALAAGGTRP